MKLDIVITGVGGQGTVLASRVLAQTAMHKGFEVRTSETIGMAQREGSVISNVRVGQGLTGAIIPDNSADILLSFELAETVRSLGKLKPGGTIIANSTKVVPVSVPLGISTYDEQKITTALSEKAGRIILLNASWAAQQAGNPKTSNVVLLGALANINGLPFSPDELLAGILDFVPEKARKVNQAAFETGRKLTEVM